MATNVTQVPPWPPVPDESRGRAARLAWYAAVARWAPSKHNTQPWRFVIRDEALELWADKARSLTATDPQQREMVISCGVAVEFAAVAASAAARHALISVFPDGGDGPVARLVEEADRPANAHDLDLLDAVARRRTDRGPLDASQLSPAFSFRLQTLAAAFGCTFRIVSRPGDRATLADLVSRADRLLIQRGHADDELAPWLRQAEDARGDGVPSDHTRGAAASARAEFVQRDFSSSGSLPQQDRQGADRPLVGVLCSPSDRMNDWVAAGRALGSLLLEATCAGANASYLNQPVEDAAIRAELRDDLELAGIPQLVLRLGVGGDVPPTPRRYLRDLISRD